MIKIAICDDEKIEQNRAEIKIKEIFERVNEEFKIWTYSSGEKLVSEAVDCGFDIVFLDIDMPEASGLNVADTLVELLPRVNVVFVTNRADLVFEALHCNPFRFIRKNRFDEEIDEAVTALIRKISTETYVITFSNSKEQMCFHISDIYYMESKKHYVYIHTFDEEYKCRLKLSDCEAELKNYGFVKIHGSFLANIRKIKRLSSKEVVMTNGHILPISRGNIDNIKLKYIEEMEKHVNGIII